MDIYQSALEWLAKGISCFPIPYRCKIPRASWAQYQQRLPEPVELRRWFARPTPINYGIITGWKGLTVIDFDSFDAFWCWRDWALTDKTACRLVNSYQVITSRGVHLYVYLDKPAKSIGRSPVEIKSCGRYVLGPGSTHPSGWIYIPVSENAPILRAPSIEGLQPEGFFEEVVAMATRTPISVPAPAPAKPVDLLTRADQAGPPLPKDVVHQIKSKLGILDLLQSHQPISTGNGWYMVYCPFHSDNHRSMSVNVVTGTAKCLAGCTPKPFDAVNLYAQMNRLSLSDAIRSLSKQLL